MTRGGRLLRGLARLSGRFAAGKAPGGDQAPRLPTMSLYLEEAFRDSGIEIDWARHRRGPSSYGFGEDVVLFRYATRNELFMAEEVKAKGGRVYYVVDDDLESIPGDPNLPADYRRRIASFLSSAWERIWNLADEAVVSSAALEAMAGERAACAVARLDPFWVIPAEDPCERQLAAEEPLRIGWLCSRSHAADLESVAEEILPVLESRSDVRFVLWAGRYLPKWLRNLAVVENREPLPWGAYRERLAGEKVDVALYPLLETAVNQGRSINKFLEHAVVGASTICPPWSPFAGRLEPGDCVLARAGEWRERLERLLDDREFRGATARQGRRRAREIAEGARRAQLDFWRSRLPALEAK